MRCLVVTYIRENFLPQNICVSLLVAWPRNNCHTKWSTTTVFALPLYGAHVNIHSSSIPECCSHPSWDTTPDHSPTWWHWQRHWTHHPRPSSVTSCFRQHGKSHPFSSVLGRTHKAISKSISKYLISSDRCKFTPLAQLPECSAICLTCFLDAAVEMVLLKWNSFPWLAVLLNLANTGSILELLPSVACLDCFRFLMSSTAKD